MAKKVVILNNSTGVKFGFGERNVVIGDKMTVADAESINTLYPGLYCKAVEETTTTTSGTK